MILKNIRIAYPHLFTPRDSDFGAKYECTLMIPKDDAETIAEIKRAIGAAKNKKFGDTTPSNFKSPVKDGDERKQAAFAGHWLIEAKTAAKDDGSGRPGVVLPNLQPAKADDVQSGDYVNADVNPFAYEQKGNRGVSFGLNNIQLVSKGDQIGGGRQRPEAVFDEIETDEFVESTSGSEDDFGF